MSYEAKSVLGVCGTGLLLNDNPFNLQGLSFFNAAFNPVFSKNGETVESWLCKFKEYGINMLRLWMQWDFDPSRFKNVDLGCTMYTANGGIDPYYFGKLEQIIQIADRLNIVLELALFSNEKGKNYPVEILEKAARTLTARLQPYRNIIIQIWNECSLEVPRLFHAVKETDPERLVSNSGFMHEPENEEIKEKGLFHYNFGSDEENKLMDILTPHTFRSNPWVTGNFWEVGPRQMAYLKEKYKKPVIDDEPARCGLLDFGGLEGGTEPWQHIKQIEADRKLGCYHIYHHDMFQNGYGNEATPPSGIPEPDFSPFHSQIFQYLKEHSEW